MIKKYHGKRSEFQEEIDKDVRRSMPEHPAFQQESGLAALRRVLTMFSFRNPVIGYAQALNIITASLLLQMKEEDAFAMLSTIAEKILPDHYTKTLVGSVVDQKVFTHLVQLYMPQLSAHMNKNYMDLSTFSVPWFVCLFLNTIHMNLNVVIMDGFFLDGPKFLFWYALSVLRIHESQLLKKRDDEAFINVLKDYFARLAVPTSDSPFDFNPETVTPESVYELKGTHLLQYTLWIAYTIFAPAVGTHAIEGLRFKYRMSVVHQMEDSYRKSQIRNICDQVKLSYEEVGIVYDDVRRHEFLRDKNGEKFRANKEETMQLIQRIVDQGSWGFVKNGPAIKSFLQGFMAKSEVSGNKAIMLNEFREVMSKISPWKSKSKVVKEPERKRTGSTVPLSVVSKESSEPAQLSIVERIYFYSTFHRHKQSSKAANPLTIDAKEFILDLGNLAQTLDLIMKQPLQTKLRYLFDLHDLDGDGMLNKDELKAVMDSLMEILEGLKESGTAGLQDDESYLRAISTFLTTALKSGKGETMVYQTVEEVRKARSRATSVSTEDTFRLGFNEFLLSTLSQSVFVDLFERVWKLSVDNAGRITLSV